MRHFWDRVSVEQIAGYAIAYYSAFARSALPSTNDLRLRDLERVLCSDRVILPTARIALLRVRSPTIETSSNRQAVAQIDRIVSGYIGLAANSTNPKPESRIAIGPLIGPSQTRSCEGSSVGDFAEDLPFPRCAGPGQRPARHKVPN